MTDTQAVPFRSPTPSPSDASTPSDSSHSKSTESQHRIGTPADNGPTPYVYSELEKKPYAVKFLELDLYNDDPMFKDVQEQAKALDDYVIKQAKAQGLKDSHESYKEVIEAMYKQIGKSANEDPTKALKRLYTAAGALDELTKAKLPPILNAHSMTPEQYEEVQP